jgi:hypothetical protein
MVIWGFASSWGINRSTDYLVSAPIWSMFALPVAYAATLAFGLPAFLLFRRVGWLSPSALTAGASIIGIAIGASVALLFDFTTATALAGVMLAFGIFGAITGATFSWLIRAPR